jgi:hypothetical protein
VDTISKKGKHKVLPSYSRAALPSHAKGGREWGP